MALPTMPPSLVTGGSGEAAATPWWADESALAVSELHDHLAEREEDEDRA